MRRSLMVIAVAALIFAGVLFLTQINEKGSEQLFYVANAGEGSISVVDPVLGEVIETIALGTEQASHGIAVSPDNKVLYTGTGFAEKSVIIMDLTDKTTLKEIAFEEGVHGIDLSPDGKTLYVSLTPGLGIEGGGLAVVDTQKMETVKIIDTKGGPAHVTVKADGSQVWVANVNGNTVAVIDTKTNELITTVEVGMVPNEVALTPDGKWAFVANVESDNLTMIDAVSLRAVKMIPAGDGPHGVAVTYDGKEIWVANNISNDVTVFDLETLLPKLTIPTGSYTNHIAFSEDGSFAYVTNRQTNDLVKIDTEKKEIVARLPVGVEPHEISLKGNMQATKLTQSSKKLAEAIVNGEGNDQAENSSASSTSQADDEVTSISDAKDIASFDDRLKVKGAKSITVEVQLIEAVDLESEQALQLISKKLVKSQFADSEIFQLYLTTHSGDLTTLPLKENIYLLVNGERISPSNWLVEVKDSHHPQYLAYFPKQQSNDFSLEVGGIDKEPLIFEWIK